MDERPWYWVLERTGGGLIVFGGVVVGAAASSSGASRKDGIIAGVVVAVVGLLVLVVGLIGQVRERQPKSSPAESTQKSSSVVPAVIVTATSENIESTEPNCDADPRELSDDPEKLIKIAESNTELRAQALLRPYLWKWIRVDGFVLEVGKAWAPGGHYKLQVVVKRGADSFTGGRRICVAWFEDEWQDRLSTLEVDDPISVRGEIRGVESFSGLELYESQLVSTGSRQGYAPTDKRKSVLQHLSHLITTGERMTWYQIERLEEEQPDWQNEVFDFLHDALDDPMPAQMILQQGTAIPDFLLRQV